MVRLTPALKRQPARAAAEDVRKPAAWVRRAIEEKLASGEVHFQRIRRLKEKP